MKMCVGAIILSPHTHRKREYRVGLWIRLFMSLITAIQRAIEDQCIFLILQLIRWLPSEDIENDP